MLWLRSLRKAAILTAACAVVVPAQDADKLQMMMQRLDALEKQNAVLLSEIQSLKETIRAEQQQNQTDAEQAKEEAEVLNQRVNDEAQSKIGASQRYPISLTGMFLFDTYYGEGTDLSQFVRRGSDYVMSLPGGGATLRQSIIGFEFHGPEVFGSKITGGLSMDFYSTNGDESVFRIRRGVVNMNWTNRSLTFGQDKPLIAPYEPTSYAHVGTPALTGAGNLWLWTPQVRYTERVNLSSGTQLSVQGAVLATDENYGGLLSNSGGYASYVRPAGELRVELMHHSDENRSFSLGVGGHVSETHAVGLSIPSRVVSADWKIKPARWFEATGTLLHGENFAMLGGLPTAFNVRGSEAIAIRGTAGWLQLAFPVTTRLTFDIYGGKQSNVARDLTGFQIAGSTIYGGNVLYRIAPNIVVGFEGSHQKISYLFPTPAVETRYDVTLAYLF